MTPERPSYEGLTSPIDPAKTVGGQAVIEGVMMRAPGAWSVTVRKPDDTIVAQRHVLGRLADRNRAARIPFVRGIVVLWESLSLGFRALSWSAEMAAGDEEEPLSKTQIKEDSSRDPERDRQPDATMELTTRAVPEAYSAFMRTGWSERELDVPIHPVAQMGGGTPERLVEQFPGERLVIPAGGFKVRANDTDYRFRAETAQHLSVATATSDAVLVMEDSEAVLYAQREQLAGHRRVLAGTASTASLWAGRRPTLNEISSSLGVETRHIDDLSSRLSGRRRPVLPGRLPRGSPGLR